VFKTKVIAATLALGHNQMGKLHQSCSFALKRFSVLLSCYRIGFVTGRNIK